MISFKGWLIRFLPLLVFLLAFAPYAVLACSFYKAAACQHRPQLLRMMQPTYGARPSIAGTSFSVWAPEAERLEVLVSAPPQFASASTFVMAKGADGVFRVDAPGVTPGFWYQCVILSRPLPRR